MTVALAFLAIVGPAAMAVWDPSGKGASNPDLIAWRLHVAIAAKLTRKGDTR